MQQIPIIINLKMSFKVVIALMLVKIKRKNKKLTKIKTIIHKILIKIIKFNKIYSKKKDQE